MGRPRSLGWLLVNAESIPTARPIIIEKFIDHTDNGVNEVARCSPANPAAMPDSGQQ